MTQFKEIFENALPEELREVYQSGDPDQIQAAFESLPPERQRAIIQKIKEQAQSSNLLLPPDGTTDMDKALKEFDSFLRSIAAVTLGKGDELLKQRIRDDLKRLEQCGWCIADPVERIWNGERDAEPLTASLDDNTAQLIQRILELLEENTTL